MLPLPGEPSVPGRRLRRGQCDPTMTTVCARLWRSTPIGAHSHLKVAMYTKATQLPSGQRSPPTTRYDESPTAHSVVETTVTDISWAFPVSVPRRRVELYCKASRAHLRHARAALATAPQCRPKGSLSLTQMLRKTVLLALLLAFSRRKS